MGLLDTLKTYAGFVEKRPRAASPADMQAIRSPEPPLREISTNLSPAFANWKPRAYNPQDDLVGRKSLRIYDEMRRDDQIKAAMYLKKLAALSTGWRIKPPNEDEGNQAIVDALTWELKHLAPMYGSLDDRLMEIMSALDYGFSITEILWQYREDGPNKGQIGLLTLKTRKPHNFEILTDVYDNLLPKAISPMDNSPALPTEKFILFVPNGEFGNWRGQSDLREAYRAWWLKDNICKYLGIYLERFGTPIATGTYPAGHPIPSDVENLKQALKNLQTSTTLTYPDTFTVELIEAAGAGANVFILAIREQNLAIARALLVPNMLGVTEQRDVGAYAQAKKHFDVFMLILDDLRSDIAEDVMQNQLIQRWMQYNYPAGTEAPIFEFLPYTDAERAQILDLWIKMVAGNNITKTPDDEVLVRKMIGFPEREVEEIEDDLEAAKEEEMAKAEQEQENALALTRERGAAKPPGGGGGPQAVTFADKRGRRVRKIQMGADDTGMRLPGMEVYQGPQPANLAELEAELYAQLDPTWEEEKHPRHPKGDARGGRFAPKAGAGFQPTEDEEATATAQAGSRASGRLNAALRDVTKEDEGENEAVEEAIEDLNDSYDPEVVRLGNRTKVATDHVRRALNVLHRMTEVTSKEHAIVIDNNTGEVVSGMIFRGDGDSVNIPDAYRAMQPDHAYTFIHTHPTLFTVNKRLMRLTESAPPSPQDLEAFINTPNVTHEIVHVGASIYELQKTPKFWQRGFADYDDDYLTMAEQVSAEWKSGRDKKLQRITALWKKARNDPKALERAVKLLDKLNLQQMTRICKRLGITIRKVSAANVHTFSWEAYWDEAEHPRGKTVEGTNAGSFAPFFTLDNDWTPPPPSPRGRRAVRSMVAKTFAKLGIRPVRNVIFDELNSETAADYKGRSTAAGLYQYWVVRDERLRNLDTHRILLHPRLTISRRWFAEVLMHEYGHHLYRTMISMEPAKYGAWRLNALLREGKAVTAYAAAVRKRSGGTGPFYSESFCECLAAYAADGELEEGVRASNPKAYAAAIQVFKKLQPLRSLKRLPRLYEESAEYLLTDKWEYTEDLSAAMFKIVLGADDTKAVEVVGTIVPEMIEEDFAEVERPTWERHVNFAEIEAGLSQVESHLESAAQRVLADMQGVLVDLVSRQAATPRGLTVALAQSLELKHRADLTRLLREGLTEAYRLGQQDGPDLIAGHSTHSYAMVTLGLGLPPTQMLAYLEAKALDISGVVKDKVLAEAKAILMEAVKSGQPLPQTLDKLRAAFRPYLGQGVEPEQGKPYRLRTIVRTNLTEAYNEGVKASVRSLVERGDVVGFGYSAVLDTATTDLCRYLDGAAFPPTGEAVSQLTPPNHFNCRSILIPLGREHTGTQMLSPGELQEALSIKEDMGAAGF